MWLQQLVLMAQAAMKKKEVQYNSYPYCFPVKVFLSLMIFFKIFSVFDFLYIIFAGVDFLTFILLCVL